MRDENNKRKRNPNTKKRSKRKFACYSVHLQVVQFFQPSNKLNWIGSEELCFWKFQMNTTHNCLHLFIFLILFQLQFPFHVSLPSFHSFRQKQNNETTKAKKMNFNLQIPKMSQQFCCAQCRNAVRQETFAGSGKSFRYSKRWESNFRLEKYSNVVVAL